MKKLSNNELKSAYGGVTVKDFCYATILSFFGGLEIGTFCSVIISNQQNEKNKQMINKLTKNN